MGIRHAHHRRDLREAHRGIHPNHLAGSAFPPRPRSRPRSCSAWRTASAQACRSSTSAHYGVAASTTPPTTPPGCGGRARRGGRRRWWHGAGAGALLPGSTTVTQPGNTLITRCGARWFVAAQGHGVDRHHARPLEAPERVCANHQHSRPAGHHAQERRAELLAGRCCASTCCLTSAVAWWIDHTPRPWHRREIVYWDQLPAARRNRSAAGAAHGDLGHIPQRQRRQRVRDSTARGAQA